MTIGLAVGLTVGGAVIIGAIVAAIIITKKAAAAATAGGAVTSSTIGGNTAQVQDVTTHSFKGWKFMIKYMFFFISLIYTI